MNKSIEQLEKENKELINALREAVFGLEVLKYAQMGEPTLWAKAYEYETQKIAEKYATPASEVLNRIDPPKPSVEMTPELAEKIRLAIEEHLLTFPNI